MLKSLVVVLSVVGAAPAAFAQPPMPPDAMNEAGPRNAEPGRDARPGVGRGNFVGPEGERFAGRGRFGGPGRFEGRGLGGDAYYGGENHYLHARWFQHGRYDFGGGRFRGGEGRVGGFEHGRSGFGRGGFGGGYGGGHLLRRPAPGRGFRG